MTHRLTLLASPTAAILLSASALLLAAPAGADQGFYLGASGGITLDPDVSLRVSDGNNTATTQIRQKLGTAGALLAGYTFANGLRPELEFGYRRSEFDGSDGYTEATVALGSVYYNFSRNGYYFYLGGGAGYADVRLDAGSTTRSEDDSVPVYALGTGIGVAVSRVLMVGVDYRYTRAFDRSQFETGTDNAPIENSFRYQSHVVGLSLRYSFGSAEADNHPAYREPREPVRVVPVAE